MKQQITKIATIITEFFKTKKGKIVGMSTLGLMLALVTVGTFLITSKNDKPEPESESSVEVVASETETTTEEETTAETTTEETTVEETTVEETTEEETTEEPTTVLEVIPFDELEIVDGDELGEDAQEEKEPEVEPETEEPETEPESETVDNNKITSAPTPSGAEYGCIAHGIDVSRHQGKIDWAQVKAAGYSFAIIRCGYRGYETGAIAVDNYFVDNIEGALANDIQVGIYFFSQATTVKEAQEEASAVIGLIKDYDITYPVAFDWETSKGWRTDIGLSNETMTSMATTYMSMIENAGYNCMLYGNKGDLSRFDYATLSQKYKIWFARYTTTYYGTGVYYKAGNSTPETICSYQMWQYTSTGRVPGISTNVDMNVAFYSYEGSGVPAAPLRVELTNETIEVMPGDSLDLMSGVKGISSSAIDITSKVTYEIFDKNNKKVTKDTALATKGKYKVVYYINDFTGVGAKAEATLMVGGPPTLTLKTTYMTYLMDTDSLTVTDNDMAIAIENALQGILKSNVTSAKDYQGKDISSSVTISDPAELYFVDANGNVLTNRNNLSNATLRSGIFVFTYRVTDSYGLDCEKTLTLEIVTSTESRFDVSFNGLMGIEEEETTEEETSEEETTEAETSEGETSESETSEGETSQGETGEGETSETETTEDSSSETESTIPWDSTEFKNVLNEFLMANIAGENLTGISVVLDEEFLNAIDTDSVEVGKEYKVKYVMDSMDQSMYYKECILVFSKWR